MVDFDPDADDIADGKTGPSGSAVTFGDFDCPVCNANNPYDDRFGDGDEVLCYYCGAAFLARVGDDGRLRLREQ